MIGKLLTWPIPLISSSSSCSSSITLCSSNTFSRRQTFSSIPETCYHPPSPGEKSRNSPLSCSVAEAFSSSTAWSLSTSLVTTPITHFRAVESTSDVAITVDALTTNFEIWGAPDAEAGEERSSSLGCRKSPYDLDYFEVIGVHQ